MPGGCEGRKDDPQRDDGRGQHDSQRQDDPRHRHIGFPRAAIVSLGLMQRLSHRLTCATIVTSMLRSRVGLQALLAALVSAFVLAAVFLLAGAMRSSAANVSAPS